MNLKLCLLPLIGALIGYATNWIAVKMLFYPHHEVRVFGRRLPFTPGVIPKGQKRLAAAAGRVVKDQLLNEEIMQAVLLSEDMRSRMDKAILNERDALSGVTLNDILVRMMTEEGSRNLTDRVRTRITAHICERIMEMNPARLLTEKLKEEARSILADSMFGMMLGGSVLDKLGKQIEEKAGKFLDDHLEEYVDTMVKRETESICAKPLSYMVDQFEQECGNPSDLVWKIYEDLVRNRLGQVLDAVDFSAIIENRINSMPPEEVEKLVLMIMERELSAVINIGALIGFVLGLFNVLILKLPL